MKGLLRGVAALGLAAVLSMVQAQDKTTLQAERERVSYAIGMDVGRSLKPIAADLDMTALDEALRNAFAGAKPLLNEEEARGVDQSLRARIAAREGKPAPGAAPGAPPPEVDKSKVGLLVGGFMVGPSLLPIKDEIELAVMMQGMRTVIAGGKPLLAEDEAKATLTAFSERAREKMNAQMAAQGEKNRTESAAFLAENKTRKGVFTTASGLQYMVLRPGAGPRPGVDQRVRVNYRGALLDGTVFDSSYDRGQPSEFSLSGVIAGWREGLALMPVGAKYRFWIPSQIGYGAQGTPGGPIGPDATLVFDVELLGIQ